MDFKAIADALVTQFSNVGPGSARSLRRASAELPAQIGATPTILVFPPTLPFTYGRTGTRKVTATYPVRFYLDTVQDKKRNSTLLLEWQTVLYPLLATRLQLGLSSYVTWASVSAVTPGKLIYATKEYEGIEVLVNVRCWEPLNAVA